MTTHEQILVDDPALDLREDLTIEFVEAIGINPVGCSRLRGSNLIGEAHALDL